MNSSGWLAERLLVPRWRNITRTVAAGELASVCKRSAAERDGAVIDGKLALWRDLPSLANAAGVVEAAIGEGREADAIAAARQILNEFPTAKALVREQAATVLHRTGRVRQGFASGLPSSRDKARELRASLRVYPYDAIGWTEFALHQVILGTPAAAARSISIALALAPHNRHVLRSAARFYLHRNEQDRAHDIILRNPSSRADPWLISAEIALARAAGRPPRFLKLGQGTLAAGNFSPRDLSELAGAIGTEHMLDGRKGLRKLFTQSLEDPTANALAQGEWASRMVGDDLLSDDRIESVPEAFEALAFHRYRESRFADVPDICEDWAKIDCFSVRPFEFGAAAASHALDFERAANLARMGLQLRPNGPGLLNALAFALGSMGDVEGAEAALQRLQLEKLDERLRYVYAANLGLCKFRAGRIEEGLAAYRGAVEGFSRIKASLESASARAYLAREAALADLPDAKKLLHEAETALLPFKKAEAQLVVKRLRGENVDDQLANAKAAQEQARKLAKLRSVTWTTPGLPGQDGVIHRLLL